MSSREERMGGERSLDDDAPYRADVHTETTYTGRQGLGTTLTAR